LKEKLVEHKRYIDKHVRLAGNPQLDWEGQVKIHPNAFACRRKKVNLVKWPTAAKPVYKSEKDYKDLLAEDVAELNRLQRLLYASNSYSVLLISKPWTRPARWRD